MFTPQKNKLLLYLAAPVFVLVISLLALFFFAGDKQAQIDNYIDYSEVNNNSQDDGNDSSGALNGSSVASDEFINFSSSDVESSHITRIIVHNVAGKKGQLAKSKSIESIKDLPGTDSVVVTFSEPQKTKEFLNEFSKEIDKSDIEEDIVFNLTASFDDPLYAQQINLGQIGMLQGWNFMSDASSIIIAIVDTGVRGTHEDLLGNVLAGYNVLTSSAILANTDSDDHGHGTAMASVATAKGNNGKGGVGIAYNAKILPVKTFEPDGTSLSSDIAFGIRWAADNNAHIINLSFGSSSYSQIIHDAIVYAKNKGCMLVASSGNEGTSLSYPGSDSEVLTVGSVNSSNKRSSFSNYGNELDIMAPGESIIVADSSNDSSYALASGTSVATAQVSGVAAYSLLWHSGSSTNERMNYFRDSAKKVIDMGGYSKTD